MVKNHSGSEAAYWLVMYRPFHSFCNPIDFMDGRSVTYSSSH